MITLNYPVILSHRHSATVSLEPYPIYPSTFSSFRIVFHAVSLKVRFQSKIRWQSPKIDQTINTGEFLSARQKKTFESVLGKFDRRMQILFLSNDTRRKAGGNLLLISMLPRAAAKTKTKIICSTNNSKQSFHALGERGLQTHLNYSML